ncbi:histidine phosphatase family protein [Virgibacillus siamensis]|uniref:histidine phosphatase family protein n=1 Tax=Virgibacillus siamensis TaxID=480071 RepID=UPI000985F1C2|nr:histidine phosphatase family protein [Virgibacillus siamensis]
MTTNLYFVRHAHSVYTPDEYGRPLSERGFSDVSAVTGLLEKKQIDCVFASPYKRAIQTVEGIAARLQKEIRIEPAFRERRVAEVPVSDFSSAVEKLWRNPEFHWQGGESNTLAQKRGVRATLDLLNKHNGENVVIGTHGNIMVLIMNYFNDQYDYEFWQNLAMPDIYQLTFSGTRLTTVRRIWE